MPVVFDRPPMSDGPRQSIACPGSRPIKLKLHKARQIRRTLMERMLVVLFNDESKAYEGSRALSQLDGEGSITIHAESVIQKNVDGTVTVKRAEGDFPIRAIGGTAIGSLIGLLGGPVGLAVGATIGATAGLIG